ncbi:MAG: hypothetical protein IKL10_05270 [Clostridia bacterium]|nr:hypothetical protein [Clostridia bacterium]
MNELSSMFLSVINGDRVVLEKDKTYHVRQDDSFEVEGFYCSNTAKKDENPTGLRRTAVFLKEKKNIVIDGNGATILVHGKMTPMLFYKCENITVKNLTIDYAVPTMTEFTVLENNDGEIIIKINPDCLFRVEGSTLYWCGENGIDGKPYWENACNAPKRYIKVFDPATEMTRDFNRNDLSFEKIEIIGENTLKCILLNKDAVLRKGEIIQTRNIIRDQVGSMFERCKNLTFENLRVKFMHGLGMVSQFCENVTYKNCDFTPREGRTIASTADFFQFSGCKGKLIIENCVARGAQDDYINVHGTHLRIIEKNDSEKNLIVRFMHPESWGFQAFEKGDILEFIKWDTLQPFGETKVIGFEKLNDTDIKLFVDSIISHIEVGKDVVENATWTPALFIRSCDFGPTSGRGILCTTRGEVIIENNRFRKLWGPALLIEDDCNFWFESGYTREIIFRNNEVISCDFGNTWESSPVIRYTPKVMNEQSEEYVHGKLILIGNSFRDPENKKHSIWLEYLREAEIKDNTFDASYEIHTHKVGNVIDINNLVRGV